MSNFISKMVQLRRWVNQVKFERNGGVPETAALTPEQQEIQALKTKINKLERESRS